MKRLILIIMAALGVSCGCRAQSEVLSLPPAEFAAAVEADTTACVLDVRRPAELAEGMLPDAHNIDFLNPREFAAAVRKLPKDRTYYIYCRSGRRSMSAAQQLRSEGDRVVDMAGGFEAYKKTGLPVVMPKK